MANINELVRWYLKSDNFWVSLSRDVLSAVAVIAVIGLALYAYAGVWPPMVSVDGTSMYPHLQDGDLILIQHVDYSKIMTYDAGKAADYSTFGNYGDVIVYQPFGEKDMTPVIHRAMYRANASDPMWQGSVAAPNSGFVTKGDNNFLFDQSSGVCPNTPVKPEWVLGVARLRIPYLGYVRSLLSFI